MFLYGNLCIILYFKLFSNLRVLQKQQIRKQIHIQHIRTLPEWQLETLKICISIKAMRKNTSKNDENQLFQNSEIKTCNCPVSVDSGKTPDTW